MRTFGINTALLTSLWLAASGCAADEQGPTATTSAVRGVATYDVESSATLTSVVGRDPQGNEVIRLDFTHGRFPVTDDIRETFRHDTEIEGRRFDVYLEGRDVWFWAVRGTEVGWKVPGPSGDPRLRAFLQEPHVKAVFDQWHIGFDIPVAANGEEEDYSGGTANGTNGAVCTGFNCGTIRSAQSPATIYMCGGDASHNATATSAWKVQQNNVTATVNGHASTISQWFVAQFCPSNTPPVGPKNYQWLATKSCPIDATASGGGALVAGTGVNVNGCPTAAENGGVGTYKGTCGCVDQTGNDACSSCPGGANHADYYGSVTGSSTQVTHSYYALTDTIGAYYTGTPWGPGSPTTTYFTAGSTNVSMWPGPVYVQTFVSLNWSMLQGCTGGGTAMNCSVGGSVSGASPSSGFSQYFNAH